MRLPRPALALLLALLVLAGCSHRHGTATATPSPDAAQIALQQRAGLGAHLAFTATYLAQAHGGRRATVRVWVSGADYRVEINEAGVTAALYGSASGTVACPLVLGQPPVCFRVAGPGQPVPTEFDAGVQRIFTQDLPTLATSAADFNIVETTPSTAVAAASAQARCFTLLSTMNVTPITQPFISAVDLGTYCLTDTGLPVQLAFASGTLTLQSHGHAPAARSFTPPAPARVLPMPRSSGPGAPSPSRSFPVLLPTGASSAG